MYTLELTFQLYTSNVGLWQNQMDILISLYILDGSRTHDIGLAPERNLRILQSRDDRIRTRDLSVRILTALPTKPPSNIKISSETNLNVHLGIDFSALYKQRWPLTESDGYTHIIVYPRWESNPRHWPCTWKKSNDSSEQRRPDSNPRPFGQGLHRSTN